MFVTASNLSVSHLSLPLPFLLNLWAPRAVTERCHDLFTAETGRIWQEATAQTDLGLAYLCSVINSGRADGSPGSSRGASVSSPVQQAGRPQWEPGQVPCLHSAVPSTAPAPGGLHSLLWNLSRQGGRPCLPPLALPLLGSPRCGARGLSRRHWC